MATKSALNKCMQNNELKDKTNIIHCDYQKY